MYKLLFVFCILPILLITINAYPAEETPEIKVIESKEREASNTEEKDVIGQDDVSSLSSESDGNPEESLNGSESAWGGWGGYGGWGRGYGGYGGWGGWGRGYNGWGRGYHGWGGYGGWGRPYHYRYWG